MEDNSISVGSLHNIKTLGDLTHAKPNESIINIINFAKNYSDNRFILSKEEAESLLDNIHNIIQQTKPNFKNERLFLISKIDNKLFLLNSLVLLKDGDGYYVYSMSRNEVIRKDTFDNIMALYKL